jgi:Predicted glycosyltransferases
MKTSLVQPYTLLSAQSVLRLRSAPFDRAICDSVATVAPTIMSPEQQALRAEQAVAPCSPRALMAEVQPSTLNLQPSTPNPQPSTFNLQPPTPNSQRPPITIIILTWNGLEYTRRCIESIRAHTHDIAYHLLVVDNGSSDGTLAWLRSQPEIRVIANERNLGFARGNNQG